MASRGVTARFEACDKLHIMLAFLDWVLPDVVPQINQTLARVANAHEHFVLQLDKMSAFPNERCPSLAWVGVQSAQAIFTANGEYTHSARLDGVRI
ncbi:MAG: hypothetical protein M3Z14_02320 [Candidatus Eremiobacteraeota bacterium]|nr:hypothetical protein [Candidatus Eremiobacteraeota bacterium]